MPGPADSRPGLDPRVEAVLALRMPAGMISRCPPLRAADERELISRELAAADAATPGGPGGDGRLRAWIIRAVGTRYASARSLIAGPVVKPEHGPAAAVEWTQERTLPALAAAVSACPRPASHALLASFIFDELAPRAMQVPPPGLLSEPGGPIIGP